MKFNINLRRCISSFIVILFAAVSVVSVSAIQIGSNDFFDFDVYSKYQVNGNLVNVTTTLPDWYHTYITRIGSGLGVDNKIQYGADVSFVLTHTDDDPDSYVVNGCPFGFFGTETTVVENGYLFDLYQMPEHFLMTGGLLVNHDFVSSAEWMIYPLTYSVYFVDQKGNVIGSNALPVSLVSDGLTDGIYHMEYEFTFDTSSISIPDQARGFYFSFMFYGDVTPIGTFNIHFQYSPFTMAFNVEDSFINFKNQQIVRDELSNINNALGDLANGTPEQNQQAQDAVGGLNSSTDKLGQLGDTMASVEKPSIDSNKISADSLVPHTSLVVLSSPFQALWENKQLLAMLTIVVTLVLVSWVFFGKKG